MMVTPLCKYFLGALCIGFLALAGCGQSDLSRQGATTYIKTQIVSALQGGVIEVTAVESEELAGTKLVLQPGTLNADTKITIALQRADIATGTDKPAGPVAVFGPAGTQFRIGATLTLPYELATDQMVENLFLAVLEEGGSRLGLSVTASDGLATAHITGFTRFQHCTADNYNPCGADGDGDDLCDPTNPGGGTPATDPCANVQCSDGQYCSSGNCICPDLLCAEGSQMDPNTCACVTPTDPCDGIQCANGDTCHPTLGACVCSSGNAAFGTCATDADCRAEKACTTQGLCGRVGGSGINIFVGDMIVGETGYISGPEGSKFFMMSDFINMSTMNTDWETAGAYLEFQYGDDAYHDMHLPGYDYGAATAGYVDNFAWGVMALESGSSLTLADGNADAGGALYLGVIAGLDIVNGTVTNITSIDGLNIYYLVDLAENRYLGGLDYALTGGGMLLAVGDGCR